MLTVEQASQVRRHCCERKHRYRNRADAMRDSTIKKGSTPYRCPFCCGHHVGNLPNMRSLWRIAQAIRVLAQKESA